MNFGKKGNRKGHSWTFGLLEDMRRSPSIHSVCRSCKKEYNGDWLGAVNIVRRFFYYMSKDLGIRESCPKQGKDDAKGSTIAPTLVEELAHRGLIVRPMRI